MPGIAGQVQQLPGRLKKKLKPVADTITAFGIQPAWLTYAEFVGLSLNVERSEIRQSFRVARAMCASDGGVDPAWYESIANTNAEREAIIAGLATAKAGE